MKADSYCEGMWGIGTVYGILRRLGLTANSEDFFCTSYAIYLAALEPCRLLLPGKWLYPAVARQYYTSVYLVERRIQFMADTVWNTRRRTLERLARRPLPHAPTPSQFIAIILKSGEPKGSPLFTSLQTY